MRAKLSRLFSPQKDPDDALDYSYEQQLRLLHDAKRGIAQVVTARKRLELQARGLDASSLKLEAQARQSLSGGREDLARQALERRVSVQHELAVLAEQIAELRGVQDKLTSDERRLASRIESFRSRKEMLKAKYTAAEARVRIGEAATGIGDAMQGTGLALERARERVDAMEARAAAIDELTESGVLESFGSPLDALDPGLAAAEVEAELSRLQDETSLRG